ncbi:hypothetical protein [Streptomyces sp. SID14478]|uniref:hypothetical protein n=1 Tax=Streptomyces sp. SID14478 TaxID=2706073 RepID=UPI001EF36AE6|nr:hypothetical protein [Streptomyces sp. SID14478]
MRWPSASRLFVVWPGQWSSDLFAIDDLEEYAKAHGIKHDDERTGLKDHTPDVRWTTSPHGQNARSPYVAVDLTLVCGCRIKDLAAFAKRMSEQQGWEVATSGGWGSSGLEEVTYSLCVRRRSLSA